MQPKSVRIPVAAFALALLPPRFIFRVLRRPIIRATLLAVASFFAGRRYFTEVVDLGVIKYGPIHPQPHPGTIAMFGAWNQMLSDPRPRLLVVRWLGRSGDMEDLAEGQYDRPSGQLTVWTRGISSFAPKGSWKMAYRFSDITPEMLAKVSSNTEPYAALKQCGTRVIFNWRDEEKRRYEQFKRDHPYANSPGR